MWSAARANHVERHTESNKVTLNEVAFGNTSGVVDDILDVGDNSFEESM